MTSELQETPIPPDMAARLPALASLHTELLSNIIILQAGQALVRAAWNTASIWPAKVERTYRFGPPAELANAHGLPYHWVYIADDAYTAAWEAQLFRNDVTRPGTFYLDHNAQQALIATLSFSVPLRLLDLTGLAASRLGIYEQLRSPDHGWCQWLGWQLDRIIAQEAGAIHGFMYPSRRPPGKLAYAISSRHMSKLGSDMACQHVRFGDAAACARLLADRLRVDPP
ncbi:RES family NAD+ phosphorylase [Janthinobacterium sp. SUN206]|uniref:RES family NAD+ phosphorylase n=1 Tax=Janthinobacterium sp. SUN206 TaxID=3014787 RepID=UPI002712C389|nr:RES family NAD+ phosphorylase [Janthinobacterium sp. SUN206]MDO8065190.1 RES family NAD+ phosphorylase [Janthinobacterium sp. SUN206]